MRGKRLLVVGLFWALLPAAAFPADWPQFRGPGNSGIAADEPLPAQWGPDKGVAWKVKLPGYGWSSPIVLGDKVFVTTAVSDKQQKPAAGMGGFGRFGGFRGGPPPGDFPPDGLPGGGPPGGGPRRGGPRGKFGPGGFGGFGGKPPDAVYRWEIVCIDRASGKTLWTQVCAEHKPTTSINPSNTYATETPITDGERVYAYFGPAGLFCYDLTGKQLWKKELGAYSMMFGHGTGASPALDGDRIFIQWDNEENSFLAALDKRTGEQLWRVTRSERSTWSTPFIWKTAAKVPEKGTVPLDLGGQSPFPAPFSPQTQVVCCGNKVRAYDPENGKVLWELGGVQGQHMATPVADADYLYLGVGGMMSAKKPLLAVRASARGDITLKGGETSNAGVAWMVTRAGPSMASPLLYRGHLYVLDQDNDRLTCHDARTGKVVYRERLMGAKGFTSSPWAGGGKVYCLDQEGTTYVVQAGPQFKLLATSPLGERCWASPAVAQGTVLVRAVEHLYCIKE